MPANIQPAGAVTDPGNSDPPLIYGIVLAAGRSSRFAAVKQLARFKGAPLVTHALRAVESLLGPRTLLVTGHRAAEVHAAAAPLQGFLVQNEAYADGLSTSLACGVRAVADVADGLLIVLADQPLVGADELTMLIEEWKRDPQTAVASRYAGVVGVPAVFPRRDFAALSELSGDRGAQSVLRAYGKGLRTVAMESAAVDIDRQDDLEQLQQE